MTHSRVGIVILSPTFFAKNWTQYELGALLRRESSDPASLIIPIWHGVDAEEVRRASPQLADRLALSTAAGLPAVVRGIERALQRLGGGQAPVPAAGTAAERHQPAAARLLPGRRIPIISWLRKHDRITVGDYIAIAFIDGDRDRHRAGLLIATREAGAQHTTAIVEPAIASNREDHPVLCQSAGAASSHRVRRRSPRLARLRRPARKRSRRRPDPYPYGTRRPVSCVAPNQSGTIPSAYGLYLIAGGRWRHEYVVADTMSWETVGATTTPNMDLASAPVVPRDASPSRS